MHVLPGIGRTGGLRFSFLPESQAWREEIQKGERAQHKQVACYVPTLMKFDVRVVGEVMRCEQLCLHNAPRNAKPNAYASGD